jgi:hypothetical protein
MQNDKPPSPGGPRAATPRLHPIAAAVKRELRDYKPNRFGFVTKSHIYPPSFSISSMGIERACVLLSLLIRVLDKKGMKVVGVPDSPLGLTVAIDDCSFRLRFKEKIFRSPHVPTPKEQASLDKYTRSQERYFRENGFHDFFGDRPDVPEWDFQVTGDMTIYLDDRHTKNLTTTVQANASGEAVLGEWVTNLVKWRDNEREHQRVEAAKHRECTRQAQMRQAERKRQEEAAEKERLRRLQIEQRRVERRGRCTAELIGLARAARRWRQANHLIAFLDAVREHAKARGEPIDPVTARGRRLAWAWRTVHRLNQSALSWRCTVEALKDART